MRERHLRSVLMVKAIEDFDRAGSILPPADRAQATREAMRALGVAAEDAGRGASDAVQACALADRAERLLAPLVDRHPIVGEVLGRTRTPTWLLAVLLLLAFASGIALSALDGSRRINILAFPFLGLIAWNLATYGVLAVAWLRRRRSAKPAIATSRPWFGRAFARRIGPLVKRTTRVDALLGRAIGGYAEAWVDAGAPFIAQHARRWRTQATASTP